MSSRNVVIGVLVILLVLVGWYYLQSQQRQPQPSSIPQAAPKEAAPATSAATPSESMEEKVVTISSSGFFPQNITVSAGETVTWVNEDTESHQVNSAVHPIHQLYPPLNSIGLLKSGEKKSLSFPDKGTYKYHDHLNPSLTGSVTVE